jgi:hypothetical protein
MLLLTPELAGVPTKVLGEKIGSLANHHGTIIAALDLVFTGI